MGECPHCGEEVGFVRYLLSDHLSAGCTLRTVKKELNERFGKAQAFKGEEE